MESVRPTAQPITSKGAHVSTTENVGFAVTKRLRMELKTLMMTPTLGISAFPETESNLFKWLGTMSGPDGTAYRGRTYRLSLAFPADYPYKAPTIKFETPCYHPNVALGSGDICLDILQDKWSAVYSVHTILVSIQSLLGDPNNASPLNVEAAELWNDVEGQRLQNIIGLCEISSLTGRSP